MAIKFYVIGFAVGIALLVIGGLSIFLSVDVWAFTRGMMLIITGLILIALAIRFKALGH
ncbi:MAG: hypothetical protein ACE5J2_00895 [Nitrososphaerales archaeon]